MTKILVGLSGGVDSAVSAYLLKKEGHEVSCGFMINYLDEENPGNCPTKVDLEEARRVAEYLELPFYTFDYREEYEKRIVEYIYREYEAGRTPNPDVFCNNLVKFDLFLEEALTLGFSGIATGHYARIMKNSKGKIQNIGTDNLESGILNLELYKGVDPSKDQSYFLSRLSPFQISKAYFPIGHLLKSEVREIAKSAGLPNALRKDSQGLCFIGKVSMKEFLERRIGKKPGNILNTNGKIVGTHEGAFSYTIGQRRGIQVGGGPALFVIGKNIKENTVTVGTEAELSLFSNNCTLSDWVGHLPEEGRKYGAKIRYRQEDQECLIIQDLSKSILWTKFKIQNYETSNLTSGILHLEFMKPQRAVASGQICVVYDGDTVIGSGIIQ